MIHNNVKIFGNFEYSGEKFTIRQDDFGNFLIKQWNTNDFSESHENANDPWNKRQACSQCSPDLPPNTV